jgi:phospholipid/cholesterol/gamma-HCH transport system substrate-binding protein
MTRAPHHRRRRTRRARTDTKRPAIYLASGLLVLTVLGTLIAGALLTPSGLPILPYQRLTVDVPDAGVLREHNDVRVAGVRVGEVKHVTPTAAGRAEITLNLDPGTAPVPRDSTVVVRGRGLLGTRFLEIVPGGSATALADGGRLAPARESLTAGVPETLDTLDQASRGGLGIMVRGLGAGLFGRADDLSDAFAVTPRGIQDFRAIAGAVVARDGAAERLLPSLRSASAGLDAARDDLALGLRPTAQTLLPLADGRTDLQAGLAAAPPAMDALTPALPAGSRLLASVRRLSAAASDTLPGAPRGLRAATALLRTSDHPLRQAAGLLRSARPAVPAVLRITDDVRPLLHPVDAALRDLAPPVRILGAHGCDIHNMTANWRSVLGYGVGGGGPIGPLNNFRIEVIAGPESVTGGSFGQQLPTNRLVPDHDLFSAPCKYGPQVYDASGLDGVAGAGR